MATALHTFAGLSEVSNNVAEWVAGVQQLTQPDRVYWCDGSGAELQRLRAEGVPLETLYIPGLGHGIDDSGIAMGALALRHAFP